MRLADEMVRQELMLAIEIANTSLAVTTRALERKAAKCSADAEDLVREVRSMMVPSVSEDSGPSISATDHQTVSGGSN